MDMAQFFRVHTYTIGLATSVGAGESEHMLGDVGENQRKYSSGNGAERAHAAADLIIVFGRLHFVPNKPLSWSVGRLKILTRLLHRTAVRTREPNSPASKTSRWVILPAARDPARAGSAVHRA